MLNFRPVDCASKQPFRQFLPGFINETIFGDRVETGWSFNVYDADEYQFALPVSCLRAISEPAAFPTDQKGPSGHLPLPFRPEPNNLSE